MSVSGTLTCIPQTDEKYISFSLGRLRFIDSWQFMQASLESLVASTPPKAFRATRHYESSEEKLAFLMRKDVYLYEYMDSLERFNETSLLPKSAFYSKLKGDITDADYEHAQKVWRVFDMKTLGD